MQYINAKKPINIILSGGGMKGAYQYGFFKRLYELNPNLKINKIYGVSVGAINSIPIVLKRIDLLDKHWNATDISPFDTIVKDWDTVCDNVYLKSIQRMMFFFMYGSLFYSLNSIPFYNIFKELSLEEIHIIKTKIIIFSFNYVENKVVIERLTSPETTIQAIKNSTCFPGLFNIENEIIDGANINLNNILDTRKYNVNWLCIDLQGTIKSKSNVFVYSPKIVKNCVLNMVNCLLVDKTALNDLIINGEKDAELFFNQYYTN